jgi:hypothetical protein
MESLIFELHVIFVIVESPSNKNMLLNFSTMRKCCVVTAFAIKHNKSVANSIISQL